MKESELLEKAADGLEEFGWTQGREVSQENHRSMCALGALKYGAGMYVAVVQGKEKKLASVPDWPYEAMRPLDQAAARLDGMLRAQGAVTVISWNDDENRTADEVITTLRHAAKFAKEDEDADA